ncbi:hypothetical protein N9937_00990 [bacterium]|nr:hypothetical protein [bacterium]
MMHNSKLADSRDLSIVDRKAIDEIHNRIDEIFESIEAFVTIHGYKSTVNIIEDLEFILQGLWGFPKDKSFHTYWYRIPTCECPFLDNYDLVGVNRRIYDRSCPFHGDMIK